MLFDGVEGFGPFGFGPLTTWRGARGGDSMQASVKTKRNMLKAVMIAGKCINNRLNHK